MTARIIIYYSLKPSNLNYLDNLSVFTTLFLEGQSSLLQLSL